MSTVVEIETAIASLPAEEREALESRLLARRFGLSDAMSADERAKLLASLDEAGPRVLTPGAACPPNDFAESVRTWLGK